MKPAAVNTLYRTLCLLLTILYPVYSSAILNIPEPHVWKYFKLQCGLHCAYGYDTDVEGNPICKCRNPCLNVFCFDGTVCVITKGRNCHGGYCDLEAVCEDEKSTTKDVSRPNNEAFDLFNTLQQDSSTTRETSVTDVEDICRIQPPVEARKCDRKQKRYYFNTAKGMCVRFRGCPTSGNNFRRRRDCKKTCYAAKSKKGKSSNLIRVPSKETSNETNVCILPLDDATQCVGRTVMRWHFSLAKGTCIRVKACKTASGNYFRKRRECKKQCTKKMRGGNRRRKGKRRSKGRRRGQLRKKFIG